MPMEEAVDRAVDECIREGILREFLLANKAEVKRMSIYGFAKDVIVAKLVRRFGISEVRAEAYYEAAAGQRG
ncbi:MAG: hypothetical protein NC123_16885 [Butyrivibrio sp.]|nr:hypothetical protein [Butyrivibrio sp.]